ncbi:hypothetical protein [Nonomuraea sp. NPDC049607]|uniref:hypothetical protein n=1 Tax=Nonomuraea sp. NPDC049607 TaxID=3154732 RepID=UPI0034499EF3
MSVSPAPADGVPSTASDRRGVSAVAVLSVSIQSGSGCPAASLPVTCTRFVSTWPSVTCTRHGVGHLLLG